MAPFVPHRGAFFHCLCVDLFDFDVYRHGMVAFSSAESCGSLACGSNLGMQIICPALVRTAAMRNLS
jgi:hypothetical protein